MAEEVGDQSARARGGAGWLASCILMLVCIGVLVAALVWFPHSQAGALPMEPTPRVPDQKLRFLTCDVEGRHLQDQPVLKAIVRLAPDFFFMQNITESDAKQTAAKLKMQMAFHLPPAAGAPALNTGGCCILSKYPLSAAEAVSEIGMRSATRVAGKDFWVCSISAPPDAGARADDQLLADWHQHGSPPIVLAGRMGKDFADGDPMHLQSGWFDALSAWERLLPDSTAREMSMRIVLSPGWSCVNGGVVTGYTLMPCWIDAASSAFATAPTTQAATQPAGDD